MKSLVLFLSMTATAMAVDPSAFRRATTEGAEKPGTVSQFFDRQGFAQGRSVTIGPGSRTLFDSHGRYEGRVVQNGSGMQILNRQGVIQQRLTTTSGAQSLASGPNDAGKAVPTGSEIRYYNPQGSYQGRAMINGQGQLLFFDRQGRYVGRSRTVKP